MRSRIWFRTRDLHAMELTACSLKDFLGRLVRYTARYIRDTRGSESASIASEQGPSTGEVANEVNISFIWSYRELY